MAPNAHIMFSANAAASITRIGLGVGVIICDSKRQILLEKRSDCGMWGLPGGQIEAGESVTETAVREVFEETGLKVKIVGLIGVYSDPKNRIVKYPDNDNVVHKVDVILEAEIVSGDLVCSCESEAVSFFALNAIPKEICPSSIEPIDDFGNQRNGMIR